MNFVSYHPSNPFQFQFQSIYSPPSINVTLMNVNSLSLLTKSYFPHIAN
jgi:hypothetical protein